MKYERKKIITMSPDLMLWRNLSLKEPVLEESVWKVVS
jgi:hypothetical protein